MTMIRKLVRAHINQLGDDEVEVVMSTASLARDGHVLVPQGCRLDNYRANPIVLWSHDPDKPIGNAEDIAVEPTQIAARARFAPLGISCKADEIRGLTKAGVIRAVSIGFEPITMEPLDPKKPRGGQRIIEWELLELSFVSVPADTGAVVTARANGDKTMPELEQNERSASRVTTRDAGIRSGNIAFKRGLYQVASLCYLFEELGWHVDLAKYEAAIEGDSSKVPGMLAAAFTDLGEALLAMTQEEIAEALAGCDVEPAEDDDQGDTVLLVDEREYIAVAPSPAVRSFRRGLAHAKLRAGKTLSTETVRCLRDAKGLHEDAMDMHRSAMRKHKDGVAAIDDLLDRSGVSDPDTDTTQTVQTSEGTDIDEGSRAAPSPLVVLRMEGTNGDEGALSAEFRRRQVEMLAFPPA